MILLEKSIMQVYGNTGTSLAAYSTDTKQRALDPVHAGWARKLLSTGQAAVWRRFPFTIILKKDVCELVTQPLRLKLQIISRLRGRLFPKPTRALRREFTARQF